MRFKVVQEKRVSDVVMLQINLEVVSRPGVLFFDCNATRRGATKSTTPDVVRFEVVKAKNQYAVHANLKHFYQAEVLVPSPIPPHLINFPDSNIKLGANSSSRLHPTVKTAIPSSKRSSAKENVSVKTSETRVTHARTCAAAPSKSATEVVPDERGSAVPSKSATEVVPDERGSTGLEVATAETPPALPKDLVCFAGDSGTQCVSPCSEIGTLHAVFLTPSKSLTMREKLKNLRIAKLHDALKLDEAVNSPPMHISWWSFIDVPKPSSRKRVPEYDAGPLKCEMPLSKCATCDACVNLGPFLNCMKHMRICRYPEIFLGCNECSRVLCKDHMMKCYCEDEKIRAAILQPTRRVSARKQEVLK